MKNELFNINVILSHRFVCAGALRSNQSYELRYKRPHNVDSIFVSKPSAYSELVPRSVANLHTIIINILNLWLHSLI